MCRFLSLQGNDEGPVRLIGRRPAVVGNIRRIEELGVHKCGRIGFLAGFTLFVKMDERSDNNWHIADN